MKVGIVDIGMGNLTSVKNALDKIGMSPLLCSSPEMLSDVDSIVLPGVGAFPSAMSRLKDKEFDRSIIENVNSGKVLVGICLGMQLLMSESEELEYTDGLNLISGGVKKFSNIGDNPIPHMGWNNIRSTKDSFIDYAGDYYFVHSYECIPKNEKNILFVCDYGKEFVAGITNEEGVYGLQFHPEKSQAKGLELLKTLLESC